MTIRDMLDAGITIQGSYDIRKIDGNNIKTLVSVLDFGYGTTDIDESILDMNVKYIYPICNIYPSVIASCIVIEVE